MRKTLDTSAPTLAALATEFDLSSKVRCPSDFVFQRAALMPPGTAEQHAC